MNAQLRYNDTLLIAEQALQPFQCVAWSQHRGDGELYLSVRDESTGQRVLHLPRIGASVHGNLARWSELLENARRQLNSLGYALGNWQPQAGNLSQAA